MAIKRYVANADTTITNAFKADLTTRGTGSNMGASDSLEVFSIYGQIASGSNATKTAELSRILINFPISTIVVDRNKGDIPLSGSVDFYLRMFNAEHPFTVPDNFTLSASAVTRQWEEGYGLDMENYSDLTYNVSGSNWMRANINNKAATATIQFNNNSAASYDGETFTVQSTDGTTVVYTLDDDTASNTYGASTTNIGIQGGPSALWIAGRVEDAITNSSNTHDGKITVARDSAAAATATIQFNSDTAANYDDETFTVTSTDGTEVVYTLNDDSTSNTYGANATSIGIQGAPAASKVSELVTAAGNNSSNAHADKITFVEGASATVTLTQDVSGQPGNNTVATTDSTDITVSGFTGGTGTKLTLTQVTEGGAGNNTISTTDSTDITVSGFTGGDGTWSRPGGDYDTFPSCSFAQTFDTGTEDLEMDITPLVEQWINSAGNVFGDKSSARYGLGVHLTSSQEAKYTGKEENGILNNPTGSIRSYYTKKFFARGSEFFFKQPTIEARWDSSTKDDRGNFYLSSSLAPAADNLMKLYLYNFVRGQLKNIPALGGPRTPKYNTSGDIKNTKLLVTIFSGSSNNTAPSGEKLAFSIGGGTLVAGDTFTTASWFATGSYSASFAFTGSSTLTKIWDVWYTSSVGAAFPSTQNQFFTGAVSIKNFRAQNHNPNSTYVVSMPNLRQKYSNSETARFRLSARKKDWNPTIYTKATNTVEASTVEDAYYKIYRVKDDYTVIDYGTGSLNHTRLSYDISGSFFDLNTFLLQGGYMYGIKYVFYENGKYAEQSDEFKFRVE